MPSAVSRVIGIDNMVRLTRISMLFLSAGLLAGSGCARTDDGTVVIPKQVDARRIWDRGPSGTQTPPVQSGSTFVAVAPPQYQSPGGARPTRRATPARSNQAAQPSSAPKKSISCGPATDQGGRVQMVCD